MIRLLLLAAALVLGGNVASAEPLTLTKLRRAALEDPRDAIAGIMKDVWADDIRQAPGSFSFTYGLFSAGGRQYLVSSFRSGTSCRPDECEWQIQRLKSDFRVEIAGKPFVACGETNKLDLEAGKLAICGKDAILP